MTEGADHPLIWIGRADYGRLLRAAEGLAARAPELSAVLSRELERAIVRPDADLPRTVVRMGSRALFRRAEGVSAEWGVLVYPDQPATEGRISVASPLGAALIGLREGDRMAYLDADGTTRRLSVERVLPA
ncbi:regulator of nucleoside diphosphate kinase [Azospirillum agricola]|uniref:GreA/GreB family elongation factor n=1 Tax=Azospirillum agricola TaxID=1720247 RepID=UPI001AE22742|nr:GreA/GreB family elongation factor [Azospirillum agricola]MBP2227851.1 regulator of nucleoside diphosphate kinase [Azospirillum agricola]